MKTLIKPQAKLNIVSFNNQTNPLQDYFNNSKSSLDFKFYQKLFLIFFAFSIFLIFPESPKDADKLCNKYNSQKVCNVW